MEEDKARILEELLRDSLHVLDALESRNMAEDSDSKKLRNKNGNPSERSSETPRSDKVERLSIPEEALYDEEHGLFDRLSDLTSSAFRLARKTTNTSLKVGRALIKSQDQLKLMVAAGESLRDLREVAGLTISDLSLALKLKDKTILEAVENGTATLSFELILRLAAVLARNDPIPFILKYTRTYSPETWRVLADWGVGRIPLQFERERLFVNIFRGHDAARKLSDAGFDQVLEFTRKAFEMSLHFVATQEALVNAAQKTGTVEDEAEDKEDSDDEYPSKERPRSDKERNRAEKERSKPEKVEKGRG